MTIGAFVVARLSSSRLPRKNILGILGKPMIELMAERVQASRLIDKVVIATSTLPSDDPLEELAGRLGIGCYRGSLDNIMERITGAANIYQCDIIVELLGDNPLVHAALIDDVITFFRNGEYDYAATITREYPVIDSEKKLFSLGVRVQVYSAAVGHKYPDYPEYIGNESKHPCAYIFDHPDRFRIGYFEATGKWAFMNRPELTFAVNHRKNFELIRSIFERNYINDRNFSLEKVYEQLDTQKYLYLLMGNE
ncbi:MAG: hypothetical protein AB1711_03825 [Thermodesulfobacteriota bacterium]